MEHQRGIALTFIAGAVAIGIFVRSLLRAVMTAFLIEDPTFGGFVTLSWVFGLVGGVAGFFLLLRNQKASSFVDQTLSELGRVHWPPREETLNNTGIVVGATAFFAGLLSVYDFTWAKITEFFLYSSG